MSVQGKAHEINIVVNARSKKVDKSELTYNEVVALAFDPVPTGDNIVITVAYRNAEGHTQGTLVQGQTVEVRNGTVFDVTATDKS